MKPVLLSVGHVHPGWTGSEVEGTQFNLVGSDTAFRGIYDDPTPGETHAFRNGRIDIGLFRASDTLFFFLARLDGFSLGWTDSPYALGRLAPADRRREPREPNTGYAMRCALLNRRNGVIEALRFMTMTPAFSSVLDGLVDEQRAAVSRYREDLHMAEIAAAYRRFPTSNDMAAKAIITERAGMKFPKGNEEPSHA